MVITAVLFLLGVLSIGWAMVGYPLLLRVLGKMMRKRINSKDFSHEPSVTLMIVAHNEAASIGGKLENAIALEYPPEKLTILITSDNSTDETNPIVRRFAGMHPDRKIRLYEAKERKGKTNAQNEAFAVVDTDILVMTDANAALETNAIRELVASFVSDDIAYVTGRLAYLNERKSGSTVAEAGYWSWEVRSREIEGRIQTITAGNGALYACRVKDYVFVDPMLSHDSAMPLAYALAGKRAICNHDAVAWEKAGETDADEFRRKVRMNRGILKAILPDIRVLNIFRYRWFTLFYLSHRTMRYLLWFWHIVLLVCSAVLAFWHWAFLVIFGAQVLCYLLALFEWRLNTGNRRLHRIFYYAMTLWAQCCGVWNILTGKAKPFWEKAESTR